MKIITVLLSSLIASLSLGFWQQSVWAALALHWFIMAIFSIMTRED